MALIQEAAAAWKAWPTITVALGELLATNGTHDFVTDTFLGMNGRFIDCDNEEAYAFFMRLFETGSFRFTELHSWLEEKVRPLTPHP